MGDGVRPVCQPVEPAIASELQSFVDNELTEQNILQTDISYKQLNISILSVPMNI